MLGEVGNMSESENKRGIAMFPVDGDPYEVGLYKLYSILGMARTLGDSRYHRLSEDKRTAIVRGGWDVLGKEYYEKIKGNEQKVRFFEAKNKYWRDQFIAGQAAMAEDYGLTEGALHSGEVTPESAAADDANWAGTESVGAP